MDSRASYDESYLRQLNGRQQQKILGIQRKNAVLEGAVSKGDIKWMVTEVQFTWAWIKIKTHWCMTHHFAK